MYNKSIMLTSYGSSSSESGGHITLENLLPKEIDIIKNMLLGLSYVSVENGRLIQHNSKKPLPDPQEDEELLPYWRTQPKPDSIQIKHTEFEKCDMKYRFPTITIQYLCGYYYSKESYINQAELLNSYGFVELRSQRDKNGTFLEIWHLCILLAKGNLKEKIGDIQDMNTKLDTAIKFLWENVKFGTLDVSVQRAAMTID